MTTTYSATVLPEQAQFGLCPDGGVRGERLSCVHVCLSGFVEFQEMKIKSSHKNVLLKQG